MKQLKRLTSVLLVLGMVLGLMPLSAFAAEPENAVATTFTVTEPVTGGENTYTYTLLNDGTYNYTLLNDGTAELTGFLPGVSVANVVIPSDVKGYPVTSIGASAFAHDWNLKTVTLSDSIISIGTGAFGGCIYLKTVNLGNSIVSIGMNAFVYCTSLASVTIPQSVQEIKYRAFDDELHTNKELLELHYTGTKAQWDELMKKVISYKDDEHTYTGEIGNMNPMLTEIDKKNFYCAHTVSFDYGSQAEGTSKVVQKVVQYEGTVTRPADPKADHYQFKDWYQNDGTKFDFDQEITEDVTLYAHWSMVESTRYPDTDDGYLTDIEHTLTAKDGSLVCVTVEQNGKIVDITENVVLEQQGTTQIRKIPAGAMVTVAANAAPEGMVFAQWSISDPELMEDPGVAYTSQTMTFPMPAADVTICAHWRMVEATPNTDPDMDEGYLTDEEYTLTAKDGSPVCVTVEENGATVDITKNVVLKKQGTTQIGKIPAGAMVTVAANAAPEGMVFAQWNISDPALMGNPDVVHTSQTMRFPMPAADVTIEAMYESAENARETELLGSAAMIGAVGISAVVLAYQAHQLGTELYLKYLLPSGAAIPQNRIQLAELLWRNAGEPVPDVNAMYEDIGLNEEAAQQAAQWALENELMELPDEEHTEQFKPDEQISYGEAIRAWKKAQQLKTAE